MKSLVEYIKESLIFEGGHSIDGATPIRGDLAKEVADNIMNQIMVSNTGPPLIKRITILKTNIIDGKRYQFFFCYLIRIFISIHGCPQHVLLL